MRRTPGKIQILTFYAYRVLRPLPAVFAVIFAMLFARKLYRYFEFGGFREIKNYVDALVHGPAPGTVGLNMQRNPLVWALPLQALLLLSCLDLLDPWGDEWFTVATVANPLS